MAEPTPSARRLRRQAWHHVAQVFVDAGWRVQARRLSDEDQRGDLVVSRDGRSFVVLVAEVVNGSRTRLSRVWSEAYLEARARVAGTDHEPLAVVFAPRVPEHAARALMDYVARVAPLDEAGIVDRTGLRMFRGGL